MILEEDKSFDDEASFDVNQNSALNKDEQGLSADEQLDSANTESGVFTQEVFKSLIAKAYHQAQLGNIDDFYNALNDFNDEWAQFFSENTDIIHALLAVENESDIDTLAAEYQQQVKAFIHRVHNGYYELTFNLPQTKPYRIDLAQAEPIFKSIQAAKNNTIALTATLSSIDEGWKSFIAENPNVIVRLSTTDSEEELKEIMSDLQESLEEHIADYNQQQLDDLEEPNIIFVAICRVIYAAKTSKKAMAIDSVMDKLSDADKEFLNANNRLAELTSSKNHSELEAFIRAKKTDYIKMFAAKVLAGQQRRIDVIVEFLRKVYDLRADKEARDELLTVQTGVIADFLATEAGRAGLATVENALVEEELNEYLQTLTVLANPDGLEEVAQHQVALPVLPGSIDTKLLFEDLKEIWQHSDDIAWIKEKLSNLEIPVQGYIASTDGQEILETVLNKDKEQDVDIYLGQLEATALMRVKESEKLSDTTIRVEMLIESLKERFQNKSDPIMLQNIKRNTSAQINYFIATHERWIKPIMAANDNNEMEAALAELKASLTGLDQDSFHKLFLETDEIDEQAIMQLKSKWSYATVALEGEMSSAPKKETVYTGAHGLPIVFQPATKEQPATLAFTRSGPISSAAALLKSANKVKVLDPDNIGDEERDGCVYQDLQACVNMLELIDSYGHTKPLKITSDDKDAARSFWALASAHGIDCHGYEADEKDSQWLESRQDDMRAVFPVTLAATKQLKAAPSSAPGMGKGHGSSSADSAADGDE